MTQPAPAPITPLVDTPLSRQLGIDVPVICGAMYPCSNPELVAAVSDAGGIGVVQPVSLTFVHGYDFREGLRRTIEWYRASTNSSSGSPVSSSAVSA